MTEIEPVLRSMSWIEPVLRDLRGHFLDWRRDPRCGGPVPGMTLYEPTARYFLEPGYHVFFGYYDVCPFDDAETTILACRVRKNAVPARYPMEIGYYELDSAAPRFHRLGETMAWCWQQGCRLQWVPGTQNRVVFYNDVDVEGYRLISVDAENGRVRERFPRPAYAVSPSGDRAISLNFSRLERLRAGYGYANLPDPTEAEAKPEDDGIWCMDLATGESKLIVSLADLAVCAPHETMVEAKHYVNHIMFNSSATRIVFMHLWLGIDGRRFSRLITCDSSGRDLYVLVNSGRVSHNWWYDDTRILAYSWHDEEGEFNYRMYVDQSSEYRLDPLSRIKQDGHPSFSPNGRRIVTDTYPDLCRRQWLMIHDRNDDEIIGLGKFFSPSRYQGDQRCDLHPRWSPGGGRIAIDSTARGTRGLCVLDLNGM